MNKGQTNNEIKVTEGATENVSNELTQAKKKRNKMLSAFGFLTIGLFIIFMSSSIFFSMVSVVGSSMEPTIRSGQTVLAVKNQFASYQRGDIAVVEFERNVDGKCIKRIIGVPGDHVELINGKFYINGELLEDDFVSHEPKKTQGVITFNVIDDNGNIKSYSINYKYTTDNYVYENIGIDIFSRSEDESLLDFVYRCASVANQITTNALFKGVTKDYGVLGDNEYFVVGDNRNGSLDSRECGNVVKMIAKVVYYKKG